MKSEYIILLVLLILAFSLGFFLNKIFLTGRAVENSKPENREEFTWTKAICNKNNECVDVLITCRNKAVVSIEPISDFVKHSSEWSDPRGAFADFLCE